jgi:uncharacterized protein YciI
VNERYFIAISQFRMEPDEVLDHLVEHRVWSKAAYDAGIMLFSGRQDPPEGGLLCFRASDLEEAEHFVGTDPFTVNGVADYSILAFTPTSFPWRSRAFDSFASTDPDAEV